jgi:hypothetical protein
MQLRIWGSSLLPAFGQAIRMSTGRASRRTRYPAARAVRPVVASATVGDHDIGWVERREGSAHMPIADGATEVSRDAMCVQSSPCWLRWLPSSSSNAVPCATPHLHKPVDGSVDEALLGGRTRASGVAGVRVPALPACVLSTTVVGVHHRRDIIAVS